MLMRARSTFCNSSVLNSGRAFVISATVLMQSKLQDSLEIFHPNHHGFAFDDRELADFGERRAELVASVTAIGKDVAQPGEAVADAGEHIGRAVTILRIGGMADGANEEALSIGDDMALDRKSVV